jgi:Domain of unknown function (DUF4602)
MSNKKEVTVVEYVPFENFERNIANKKPRVDNESFTRNQPKKDKESLRSELAVNYSDIFKSVTEFGAKSFVGKDKKIWEAKQLAALGAKVVHKEKMPLKMAIGVLNARKKKMKRLAEDSRLSQVITGKKLDQKQGGKNDRKRKQFDDDITPSNIRGSVMFVGRN